jgi:predicted MFS family arabinose efflux permease
MVFAKRAAQPERLIRVARLYLAYKFFGALFFAYPVFYEFASQTITPVQVGMFFSAIGICSLVADVPSGIIADRKGRKVCGLVGASLLSVAPIIVFIGHSVAAYLAAALFYGLGRAFLNGALEALVYDHKHVTNAAYRRVNALEISFGQAGILVSAACGGWLFSINHGLPFICEAIAGLICVALIVGMREQNKTPSTTSHSVSHRQHFVQSVSYLLATPYLRILVVLGVVFSVMLGMCIQFVNEATMIEHGFVADQRGMLIAGAGLATIILVNLIVIRFVRRDSHRLLYLGGGAVLAYSLMSSTQLSLFLIGYLVWSCLNATSSFIRVILNDHIPGSHRSTILSNFKALAVLAGMASSTATGLLVQWAHTPRAAYMVFASIAALGVMPCAVWLVVRGNQQSSPAVFAETAALEEH